MGRNTLGRSCSVGLDAGGCCVPGPRGPAVVNIWDPRRTLMPGVYLHLHSRGHFRHFARRDAKVLKYGPFMWTLPNTLFFLPVLQ